MHFYSQKFHVYPIWGNLSHFPDRWCKASSTLNLKSIYILCILTFQGRCFSFSVGNYNNVTKFQKIVTMEKIIHFWLIKIYCCSSCNINPKNETQNKDCNRKKTNTLDKLTIVECDIVRVLRPAINAGKGRRRQKHCQKDWWPTTSQHLVLSQNFLLLVVYNNFQLETL